MKRSTLILVVSCCLALAALTRWNMDGRQLWTKQQMVVETIEKDDLFGAEVRKTTLVSGFWLGLDVAGSVTALCALVCIVTLRIGRTKH